MIVQRDIMQITEEEADIIRRVQAGILSWYRFEAGQSAVYVGDEKEPVYIYLRQMADGGRLHKVVSVSPERLADFSVSGQKFDYAISIAAFEKVKDAALVIRQMTSVLCDGGHLLLGMNNRFGIRYFCGDRDVYTHRNFDGIENYRRVYAKAEDTFSGRMYSLAEMKQMLRAAGWKAEDFFSYSVFSGLDYPQFLFAEGYTPNEDLVNRIIPKYGYPETAFLEEDHLYAGLMDNGMFHQMANAYLIDCSHERQDSEPIHEVSNSLERLPEHAFSTVIFQDMVSKKAYQIEANESLKLLASNTWLLADRHIPAVDGAYHEQNGLGVFSTDYIHADTARSVLTRAAEESRGNFFKLMDLFMQELENSSDIAMMSEPEVDRALQRLSALGMNARESADMKHMLMTHKVMKKGLFDFVPINSFYVGGKFLLFDQEFLIENLPLDVMKWRVTASVYSRNETLEKLIPQNDTLHRYGIYDDRNILQRYEMLYLEYVRNDNRLRNYSVDHCTDPDVVNANRQRINFSEADYRKIFVDTLENADARELILFGSGNYAREFLEIYGEDYAVSAIVDNNRAKWGSELSGVRIYPPDYLKQIEPGTYKVIICIKNYPTVLRQLDDMKVTDYGVFNPGAGYKRKLRAPVPADAEAAENGRKKYHIGYIAGVFDLFHIGHLNMFRRAKELCDYLIVGVVTDEEVMANKHTSPFIPFNERIEIVRSCRYVDDAVRIPAGYGDTNVAWRSLHFDVQFSGSDYEHDPIWLAKREFLRKHGADLVFFPYTQQTSSTKIKALIDRKLDDSAGDHADN